MFACLIFPLIIPRRPYGRLFTFLLFLVGQLLFLSFLSSNFSKEKEREINYIMKENSCPQEHEKVIDLKVGWMSIMKSPQRSSHLGSSRPESDGEPRCQELL